MSSTNKTENYGLNSWISSDIPKREDFNTDNVIIDNALANHCSDAVAHTSNAEKQAWSNPYYIQTYFGNGSSSRTLALNCDFTPVWGIVFAVNYTPSVTDISNEANYNYFAVFTASGSNTGVTLSGKSLKLVQSSTAVLGNEYRNFNQNGVTYLCIMFR